MITKELQVSARVQFGRVYFENNRYEIVPDEATTKIINGYYLNRKVFFIYVHRESFVRERKNSFYNGRISDIFFNLRKYLSIYSCDQPFYKTKGMMSRVTSRMPPDQRVVGSNPRWS